MVTQRDSYSISGLPQCRFCQQKFTRWRNLQRRIQRNGCPALRSNDKDAFMAASQPAVAALPPSSVGSQMTTAWKPLSEVSAAGYRRVRRTLTGEPFCSCRMFRLMSNSIVPFAISGLRKQMVCGSMIALCMQRIGRSGLRLLKPNPNCGPRRPSVRVQSVGPVYVMPDNMQDSVLSRCRL